MGSSKVFWFLIGFHEFFFSRTMRIANICHQVFKKIEIYSANSTLYVFWSIRHSVSSFTPVPYNVNPVIHFALIAKMIITGTAWNRNPWKSRYEMKKAFGNGSIDLSAELRKWNFRIPRRKPMTSLQSLKHSSTADVLIKTTSVETAYLVRTVCYKLTAPFQRWKWCSKSYKFNLL